jgi:flagellar hook-associated protein 3 FlgL
MRIADKMQFDLVHRNVTKNRSDMNDLQNQAATQKRINKPSDDPLASTRVLGARTEERGNSQFIKNIANVKSFLEFTDQNLSELSELVVRAKELAIQQSNDASGSAAAREVTALEVEQIFSQAVQIGNRKLGDRYLFSGTKTETPPFTAMGDYQGDNGEMKIQTHKEAFITMNLPGSQVFQGKGLGPDGFGRPNNHTPKNVVELQAGREEEKQILEKQQEKEANRLMTRGPASFGHAENLSPKDPVTDERGVNIFQLLKGLEVSMRTNDKEGIQDTLDTLDQALSQIVLARAEVGARIIAANHTEDTLRKANVDMKGLASQLEDADVFQVISDINKTDSALRATLEVSPKLIQTSLLDFLR